MTKAYSYIRMSRPEQLKGDSLRRQFEATKKYAAEHGLELDESLQLRDLGLSAYTGAHVAKGALGAFLACVKRGEVPRGSSLIVESLDRLSRESVLDALEQFMSIINADITIVTLIDQQVYNRKILNGEWTKLILSLGIMSRAHEESLSKGKRVADAWGKKREKAADKPLTKRCPAWLRLIDDRFEVIEERAAVVHRIFQQTAAGIGRRALVAQLNREGVPTFGRSKGWQPSYVAKLLESEAVLGTMQPHRKIDGKRHPEGEPVREYFPAIIPDELFWQARAATTARQAGADGRNGVAYHGGAAYTGGGSKGENYTNLFTRLARCACGGRMVLLNKGKPPKGGRYLTCDHAYRGLDCSLKKNWRYDVVESVVLDRVARVDLSRVLGQDDRAAKFAVEVEALRAKLLASEETERRMVEAFEGAPTNAVAQRLRKLESDIEVLRVELRTTEERYKAEAYSHIDMPTRLAAIEALRDQMSTLTGDDLYSLRARLAQELRRSVKELRFTRDNITAFYAVPSPTKQNRLAVPDQFGHPLIITDGDEAPGDDAEAYALQQAARRRRTMA